MTDLAAFIRDTTLVDTHEHLHGEQAYLEQPFDILKDLFLNYFPADLRVAGASEEDAQALCSGSGQDIAARFEKIRPAWDRSLHTGYGEAVRIIASEMYGIEEITGAALEAKAHLAVEIQKPGMRLSILRDKANLDHVQVDFFKQLVVVDESGPDFFLYDIGWMLLASGRPDSKVLHEVTGIEVAGIDTLDQVMEKVFERSGKVAVAVKSQHAYDRTLRWQERTKEEAGAVLDKLLAGGELEEEERLCLGDWCLGRGVELSVEYHLPFKIHTGYYAGHSYMHPDRIRSGHLAPLLRKYPDARFVLMHAAYPYCEELIALAKHFPNVTIDMCWMWSINPYTACDVVRRFIHAVPANKIFAFGGDIGFPSAALAYSRQARKWLTYALQGEVSDGYLSEEEAIRLASRFMRENQYEYFDLSPR